MILTLRYEIGDEGQTILCLTCGLKSWNPNDVAQRYCVRCKVFHEDEVSREALEAAIGRAGSVGR